MRAAYQPPTAQPGEEIFEGIPNEARGQTRRATDKEEHCPKICL